MTASSAVVVMGPAGSGKTTVGQALAKRLGWRFLEGDSFHSAESVAKMAAGTPLTDIDRAPWLERLAGELRAAAALGENVVLACSALKERYRDVLRVGPGVRFVFLKASADLLQRRLGSRKGHFVSVALLASQLADLEEPRENAIVVNAADPVEAIVGAVVRALGD